MRSSGEKREKCLFRSRITWVIRKLNYLLQDIRDVRNSKATGMLEYEIGELENIFSLLLFGSLTGLPSPPAQITLQLLPLMENEVLNMLEKVQTAKDPLGELAETLGEF